MRCDAGEQVTPEKRAQAKQMAYGLLYGMGKHALARSMGVPPDTAQQLSDSFRASIPDLVCLLTAPLLLFSQPHDVACRTDFEWQSSTWMHGLGLGKCSYRLQGRPVRLSAHLYHQQR